MTQRSGKTSLTVNWVWIVVLVIFTLASLSLFNDSEYMEKTGPGAVWATIVLFLGFIGYNIYRIKVKKTLPKAEDTSHPTPDAVSITSRSQFPSRSELHERSADYLAPPKPSRKIAGNWVPPNPSGEPFMAWGPGTERIEVVGEWYRQGAFSRLFADNPDFTTRGASTNEPATLVPDPHNPHSRKGNAVAVFVSGQHVGYLPNEIIDVWGPLLRELATEGLELQVKCRTYARMNYQGKEEADVVLQMPDPDAILPANGFPTGRHVEIPFGRKRQVTREEEYLDTLRNYVTPGHSNYVAATMKSITDIRARSVRDVVEISIDGKPVGILTDLQSKNFLPLVRHIEARGKTPVIRAAVEGTVLKAEVVFWAVDAAEVDPDWLESLGPEVPKPVETVPGPDWDWGKE